MIFFPIFTVLMSAGHLNTSAFCRYFPSKAPFLGSSNKPLSILFLLELKSKWPGTQIFPVRESPRLPAKKPLLSPAYISQARATCLLLLMQLIPVALALALAKAGSNKPAKIAIMAITTSSSMRVKPEDVRLFFILVISSKAMDGGVCRLTKRLSIVNRAQIRDPAGQSSCPLPSRKCRPNSRFRALHPLSTCP